MKYRPEIDGLRAIAVLSVVIYHCDLFLGERQILPGGYLGVDVFFVISGYLITKIVNDGIEARTFRYSHFYDRRARRLMPAFITVALFSTVAGYLLLSAAAMKEFSGSVLSAIGFSSNFFFWGLDDYVAEPSKLRPMLHTWSLAVEEQFYFILPPLLALFHMIWKNRVRELFLIVSLASFLWAIYLSRTDAKTAFYLIPTRAWELGLGSLIALYAVRWSNDGRSALKTSAHIGLPVLGLCMVIYSVVILSDSTPHPSEYTAIAVAGTGLLLVFSEGANPVGRMLSLGPVRWIGLLSYSFYLWHWPVIVFAKYQTAIQLPSWVWAFVSLLLCTLAYYLIEKPLRYGPRWRSYAFIGAGLVSLIGFHAYSWATDGIPQRRGDTAAIVAELQNTANSERASAIRIPNCHLRDRATKIADNCNRLDVQKPNVMLVGDSLGADLFIALQHSYPQYNFLQFTGAGCSFMNASVKNRAERCDTLWAQALQVVDDHTEEIDLLIVHGRRIDRMNWQEFDQKFGKVPILVVGPRYEITPDPRASLELFPLELVPDVDNTTLKTKFALNRNEQRALAVENSVAEFGYGLIDLNPIVFDKNELSMFSDGGSLNFTDYAHWSVGFGKQVGARLAIQHPDLISLGKRSLKPSSPETGDFHWTPEILNDLIVPNGIRVEQGTDNTLILHGTINDADSSGRTGGVSLRLPDEFERAFSGSLIEVSVDAYAFEIPNSISVAYSTNEVGNSRWQTFNLSRTNQTYSFEYRIRKKIDGKGDYIGLLPNSNGESGPVVVTGIRIRRK